MAALRKVLGSESEALCRLVAERAVNHLDREERSLAARTSAQTELRLPSVAVGAGMVGAEGERRCLPKIYRRMRK